MSDLDRMLRQTLAVETCPSCGRRQHVFVAKLDSGGSIEKCKCKSCGCLFGYHRTTKEERKARRERRLERWRQYYKEHAEKLREYYKTPQRMEASRKNSKRYYWTHRDEILAKRKANRKPLTDEQRAAMREQNRAWRAANPGKVKAMRYRRYQRLVNDDDDAVHGTYYGYCLGCRCDRCKQGRRDYEEKRKSA